MRLIDLDNLMIGLRNPDVFENKYLAKAWNDAIRCLFFEKVVDPVEIAGGCYCKECIDYDGGGLCKNQCGLIVANKETGFCCYGKKKN